MPLTAEERRAYMREWNKANPDKLREYHRRWEARNREQRREYQRRWLTQRRVERHQTTEERRARSREWNKANPDKLREYHRRYHARRKAAWQAEVEAVADQAAQSAPMGRVVAPCGHCGGQIIMRWEDPACLQCGRSPTAARVLTKEEQRDHAAAVRGEPRSRKARSASGLR